MPEANLNNLLHILDRAAEKCINVALNKERLAYNDQRLAEARLEYHVALRAVLLVIAE